VKNGSYLEFTVYNGWMKPKPPKPDRPKGFPLYAHAAGYWAKCIRGKTHYFGKWDEPDAALEKYLAERDYLVAGKKPPNADGISILEVLDRFLVARQRQVNTGELAMVTYLDYKRTCKLVSSKFGGLFLDSMMPEDFAPIREYLAAGVGVETHAKRIREARVAMNYLSEITGQKPNWGKSFREPSAKTKRVGRVKKLYSAEQVRGFIEAASSVQFKAMILLGINCAFGNGDCASLLWSDIELSTGWHRVPRAKTGIDRKAKLWPETIEALSKVKTDRRGLVFKTRLGNPWIRESDGSSARVDSIACEARKIGLEFYTLRHTFRTVSDACGDSRAIDVVMGHMPSARDMGAVYIQEISDERVERVAEFVRKWLFTEES
jgi:integrase